ncbi:MAG: alpha/beta hydrolase [Hyphomonas sp.]|uniref:alpha/beta fold hydrolase n=1 Tax=Hyphomonas sp. TaxID=87 RepID=UPI0017A4302C|nr:alpha/beta hydrolase [Hyphomonas sp.]MBA3070304.1 alpha/beta hydrolase [Hyphomonas sp.]MBU3919908.1 alpha/beta hydrolase [Alphaproteobacteria bacterium]MBU4062790.1 alpha/beta hydrolase [Alphaproteobacteria bacterium]MBU4163709.1 alpha/beta hydrolase [Alphaproteobacteria bacterium]
MARAKTNGIEIEYDTMGSPDDPAVLLVMGFALQMTRWPEGLKRGLADAGFRVIWFDNRDVGLSTDLAQFAPPSPMDVLTAAMTGQDASKLVPYTLSAMAADSAGLLDAIGVAKADVLGVSMGGMIAQLMALDHPHKVRKLIPVMTTSGDPLLPPATPEALAALTAVPASRTPEAIGDIAVHAQHAIGSHPDLRNSAGIIRARAIEDFHRSDRPFGMARQYTAILATPRWHERLDKVTAPTLVLHGADDPLVRPAAGQDIARRIPGAVFKAYPKWGHDLSDKMADTLVADIVPFLRA